MDFKIAEVNIQRMIDLGVIATPDYWRGITHVRWLNELLANAGGDELLDHRIVNGIIDFETALKVLQDAGIMNSPDYWRNLVSSGSIRFLDRLIINIANRCLDPLHRIVWAEARGEDIKGQILVGNVVLNRHKSSRFPNGIHAVIFQRNVNSKGVMTYQFSPVASGAYARATPTKSVRQAVGQVLDGVDLSQGALFFMSIRGVEGSWHEQALTALFDHGSHRFFI